MLKFALSAALSGVILSNPHLVHTQGKPKVSFRHTYSHADRLARDSRNHQISASCRKTYGYTLTAWKKCVRCSTLSISIIVHTSSVWCIYSVSLAHIAYTYSNVCVHCRQYTRNFGHHLPNRRAHTNQTTNTCAPHYVHFVRFAHKTQAIWLMTLHNFAGQVCAPIFFKKPQHISH